MNHRGYRTCVPYLAAVEQDALPTTLFAPELDLKERGECSEML